MTSLDFDAGDYLPPEPKVRGSDDDSDEQPPPPAPASVDRAQHGGNFADELAAKKSDRGFVQTDKSQGVVTYSSLAEAQAALGDGYLKPMEGDMGFTSFAEAQAAANSGFVSGDPSKYQTGEELMMEQNQFQMNLQQQAGFSAKDTFGAQLGGLLWQHVTHFKMSGFAFLWILLCRTNVLV